MDLNEAIRLIHPDTSKEAIRELEDERHYTYEQVINEIEEAIKLICDIAKMSTEK